jgi:hypothetical protein
MRRGSAQMKLSLDQKIAVSLLVFLIICLLVFWVLLEKPVQTPDGADEARNLQPILLSSRSELLRLGIGSRGRTQHRGLNLPSCGTAAKTFLVL